MSTYRDKINNLPENVKDFFISDEPMMKIKKSFAVFDINSSQSEKITKEIGLMYAGDMEIKQLPDLIKKNINIGDNIAYGIAYEINKRIFNKFPDYFKNSEELLKQWEQLKSTPVLNEGDAMSNILEQEPWIAEIIQEERKEVETRKEEQKKQQANIIKIPLLPAIQKYPKIGEQPVTASPIKLRSFPAPARPSVKNWLADYRENLGAGHHGVVERGNYLFHGENAKKLNSNERQKLAWILKSLEEDAPLEIDISSEIIIFPLSPHPLPGRGEGTRSEGFKRTGGQPVKQTTNNRQQTTYNQQPTINNLQSATSSQSIVSPKKSFLKSIFSKKEKQDEIPVPKSIPQEIKNPEIPLAGAAKTEEKNKETSQPSPAPRKIYKDIKFSRPSFNEINPIGGFEDEFENNSRSGAKINGNKVDLRP